MWGDKVAGATIHQHRDTANDKVARARNAGRVDSEGKIAWIARLLKAARAQKSRPPSEIARASSSGAVFRRASGYATCPKKAVFSLQPF